MNKIINLFMAMFLLVSVSVFGADNSIYIDQSGDNSTIDITQTGSGNVIRGIQGVGTGNTTPAKLYGGSSTIDIQQIGSTNTLNLGFNASTATGRAYGIDLTYYVTGNSGTFINLSAISSKYSKLLFFRFAPLGTLKTFL